MFRKTNRSDLDAPKLGLLPPRGMEEEEEDEGFAPAALGALDELDALPFWSLDGALEDGEG